MMDNNSIPIDLRIKRKFDDIEPSTKKKSRSNNDYEIPLDLSVKTPTTHSSFNPISTVLHPATTLPFYDPTNLLLNSSALLYDLFLANFNSFYQQRPTPVEPCRSSPSSSSSTATTTTITNATPTKSTHRHSTRSIKENHNNKQELYACSCGEKYSNVAHLVTHLKMTNHHAQLSSNHDEVAKLVRGQDIWLSRDTNPANQILKCLRCSLSFETLPDLTAHMMKTNHFTQLLPSNSSHCKLSPSTNSPPKTFPSNSSSSTSRSTCLICSQSFARETDLINHIQHVHQIRYNCTTCGMYFESEMLYKDHILKEMHHRNGKTSKNRDYFLQQLKTLPKKPPIIKSTEQIKRRSSVEKEVEFVIQELVDRIVKQNETTHINALSLLQNFVIEKTPTSLGTKTADLNNNHFSTEIIDEENHEHDNDSEENEDENSIERLVSKTPISKTTEKSNENPLVSLEKMLAYPSSTIESFSSTMIGQNSRSSSSISSSINVKKKKFDKYRLFAEKMLRSTLS